MGRGLAADSDATIVARASLPDDAVLVLLNGNREVASARGEIRFAVTGAQGAYRVEVRVPGAPGEPPIPWLVSNPVYFGAVGPETGGSRAAPTPTPSPTRPAPSTAVIPPFPWRIEKDATSSAILRTSGGEVSLQYQLGPGERNNQFVALATDLQPQAFSVVDLSLSGDRPLRVSVQMRAADGRRWGRSYYVDPKGTALRVPVSALTPIGSATGAPDTTQASSLLLVIDLTNAAPGRAGTLTVQASALTR
jgi:hypothetical protein